MPLSFCFWQTNPTMDTVISLLVLSALPHFLASGATVDMSVVSFRAVLEMVSGHSRIFSNENVQLRCSIPDKHNSTWNIQWFRGSKKLNQGDNTLSLWMTSHRDSGKYHCRGERDTLVGKIKTLPSVPVELNVDGGWAILRSSLDPGLVGQSLNLTCHVRGNPRLREVILYKDGLEVRRQSGPNFYLSNLTLEERGLYSCSASWDVQRRSISVISAATEVQVLEVLSNPELEINTNQAPTNIMLICHIKYNAQGPVPPINYYFYMNDQRLGTATSENYTIIRKIPGRYSCKAKIPKLGLTKLSEAKSFGRV